MAKLRIFNMRPQNDDIEKDSLNLKKQNGRIGYARVSTDDQHLDLQLNALRIAGCSKIYTDRGISGTVANRPGLQDALNCLSDGDTLVVWRLDRLGRSLVNLVELVNKLGLQGVEFQSLTESIDTTSSGGRLIFHIMAALAEFERSLISERTRAGMEAARLKGKHIGRPRKVKSKERKEIKSAFIRKTSISEIAKKYNISTRAVRAILSSSSETA
ncbi:recombinase family protein [Brucella pseudogrignonensis]|uniref:recombinase family protein n=1 Tax=Brucella pseudogrignonensis TaxID=419475 RepID=UPI0038B421CF